MKPKNRLLVWSCDWRVAAWTGLAIMTLALFLTARLAKREHGYADYWYHAYSNEVFKGHQP